MLYMDIFSFKENITCLKVVDLMITKAIEENHNIEILLENPLQDYFRLYQKLKYTLEL